MLSLQAHAVIVGAIFLAIVVLAMVGNALQAVGAIADPASLEVPAKLVFFALTVMLCAAAAPLLIKLFVVLQVNLGNGEQPFVAAVAAHERAIAVGAWLMLAVGLGIALPGGLARALLERS